MWTYFLVAIFGRRERESRASPGAQFGLSLAAFLRYVSFNWINAISLAMCAHFVSTENDVMGEEKVGPSAMNTWYRIVDRAYAVAIFTCFWFFSESYDLIWILLNDLRDPAGHWFQFEDARSAIMWVSIVDDHSLLANTGAQRTHCFIIFLREEIFSDRLEAEAFCKCKVFQNHKKLCFESIAIYHRIAGRSGYQYLLLHME